MSPYPHPFFCGRATDWCSAWAPLALDYTQKMGIEPEPDAMSVLVQQLLPADSAGVLFTADPLTGNPWRFVLESSFGLARDLVASTGTTPVDRFLSEWDTGEILGRDIAPKKTALFPGASGIDNIDIPPDRQSEPSLNDDLATRIAQVGLLIDRAFGARVDVEWVVEGDDIHIVQVRPLTALPAFFPHHLPNIDVNDLTLGHHAELDPYWPHLLIAEAEQMAKLLEPERERFEGLSLEELIRTLEVGEAPVRFIAALEDYCDRLGSVPPWQLQFESEDVHASSLRWHSNAILRLIRNALRGGPRIAQIEEEAFRHREAVVAEVREILDAQSADLTREDVMVLLKPAQSNNNDVPLLFSMLLRVRGLIVPPARGMWTGHISQIARECRVPIVQVAPSDLERLVDGCRIDVDGTRGIVTLIDA